MHPVGLLRMMGLRLAAIGVTSPLLLVGPLPTVLARDAFSRKRLVQLVVVL